MKNSGKLYCDMKQGERTIALPLHGSIIKFLFFYVAKELLFPDKTA